jgi:vitamin B12 transporter
MRRLSFCCAFSIFILSDVRAEQLPIAVAEPLVVTATRIPTAADQALQPVAVVTREAIEHTPTPDALMLLRAEPGFENARNGGVGAFGSVFLRGTESDQTLVLIDGIRINSVTDGGAPLTHVMLGNVERAELVRGNVSSLYGSQAIGGVIALFTGAGLAQPGATLSAGLGSLGTGQGGLRINGGTGATRYKFAASYLGTDGFSSIRAREIPAPFFTRVEDLDDDGYRNATFNAAVSHTWEAGHELSASVLETNARTEFDGVDENRTRQRLSVFALNSVNALTSTWTSRLTLGQAANRARNFLDALDTGHFNTRNQQLTWQNEVQLTPSHTVLAGLEWLRQKVDSTRAYEKTKRRVTSPFLGYYWRSSALSAQVSLRHDRYSDVENATSGRLSLGYALSPRVRLRAGVASAFKAPTFDDQYFPGFSNPALRPERARSVEAGVQLHWESAQLDLQAFSNRSRDLITFDFNLVSPKPINVNRAENDGIEITLSKNFGALKIHANATWQDPRDRDSGERLLRRAKRFGALGFETPVGRATVRLQILASGPREDFARPLGGYAVVDGSVQYPLTKHTRLQFLAENLFDKDYELAAGYNVTPQRFLVELTHSFW